MGRGDRSFLIRKLLVAVVVISVRIQQQKTPVKFKQAGPSPSETRITEREREILEVFPEEKDFAA